MGTWQDIYLVKNNSCTGNLISAETGKTMTFSRTSIWHGTIIKYGGAFIQGKVAKIDGETGYRCTIGMGLPSSITVPNDAKKLVVKGTVNGGSVFHYLNNKSVGSGGNIEIDISNVTEFLYNVRLMLSNTSSSSKTISYQINNMYFINTY